MITCSTIADSLETLRPRLTLIKTALILAGCTNTWSSLLSIYLISLSYQRSTVSNSSSQANPGLANNISDLVAKDAELEVRTGYFSLCVKYADGFWVCRRDVADLVQRLRPDLVWQSRKLRDEIVFYPLM